MLRYIIALTACAAVVAALDTPLTLPVAQGNRVIVVDPAYGSIAIYEVTSSSADRMSGMRKPQANFLADIDLRLKSYLDERDGVPFQAIRIGWETKPTYSEMFTDGKWLPDKPTSLEAKAGKKALQWRALAAENSFWQGEVAYDGVVRAALSSSGQNLMLALPSLHCLLLYRVDGEAVTLVGVRNFGPELFMTGLNTAPNPRDLIQEVLKHIPKEREAEVRTALGLDQDAPAKAGDAPAVDPGKLAAEEPPTPKSELWIGPGQGESFIVVDTANARSMLYRTDGKGLLLAAVRDLSIDLVIPGLVGGSLRSNPSGDVLIKNFFAERKAYIIEYGLPTEKDEILLLIGQHKPAGKPSPFEAVSASVNGAAMLNFVDRRVFLTLDSKGGNQLNLTAARDYSLDIAITLLDQEILDRLNAKNQLVNARRLAGDSKRKSALLTLRLALNLDPRLHKDAEKSLKDSFRGDADQQAQFQALLDEAAKNADTLAKQTEERKKALAEKRKAK
jgi:hypothetical protein